MLRRNSSRISWIRPPAVDVFGELTPTERAVREHGLPRVPDAATAEEEALLLLEVAAEVEHSLLVQYLYAGISVQSPVEHGRTLQTISEEEMGHLATVQNLRIALGGDPYLGRQDGSPQADVDPIPFRREPLSLDSLAKYVAAETPLFDPADPLHDKVLEIVQRGTTAAQTTVNRVGLLYSVLYWLFQSSDAPEGPWVLPATAGFPAGRHITSFAADAATLGDRQTGAAEWNLSGDITIDFARDRSEALAAIHRIAVQGEGLEASVTSHFSRFFGMYLALEGGGLTVHELPVDPTTGSAVLTDPAAEANRISEPKARAWARLADARYEILLILLGQAFAIPSSDGMRQTAIDWALQEMSTLARVGTLLRSLPRQSGAGGPKAALPLNLPAADLPNTVPRRWAHLRTSIAASATLIAELRAGGVPAPEEQRLKRIESEDAARLQALPPP